MNRKLAAIISVAVVFSGSFALSTQSVEAKTPRNSHRTRNYLVPPPPPYIPSMVPAALGMMYAQAVTADENVAVVGSEAKTSQNGSHSARNYIVPPPPPYTPFTSALGMTNAQAATADGAAVNEPVNPYSKYIFTRSQGNMPQVVRPNPYLSYNRRVEKRVQKQIDYFDSEISSQEQEIGKLLNL